MRKNISLFSLLFQAFLLSSCEKDIAALVALACIPITSNNHASRLQKDAIDSLVSDITKTPDCSGPILFTLTSYHTAIKESMPILYTFSALSTKDSSDLPKKIDAHWQDKAPEETKSAIARITSLKPYATFITHTTLGYDHYAIEINCSSGSCYRLKVPYLDEKSTHVDVIENSKQIKGSRKHSLNGCNLLLSVDSNKAGKDPEDTIVTIWAE